MTCLQLTLSILAVALLLTTLQEKAIPDRQRDLHRRRQGPRSLTQDSASGNADSHGE